MTITVEKEGLHTVLHLEGRVDSNNADQFQRELLRAFQSDPSVIVDCRQLAYISSAGLRVLLIGQKTATSKGGKFELCHVPPVVLSTLQLVGFDSILRIRQS